MVMVQQQHKELDLSSGESNPASAEQWHCLQFRCLSSFQNLFSATSVLPLKTALGESDFHWFTN